MNNRKYNILLAKVMMLPFTKTELIEKDYFYDYANAYNALVTLSNDSVEKTRKGIKDAYHKAYEELITFAFDDDRWNHIDDLCKILDVFFPGRKLSKNLSKDKRNINNFYINYILEIARVFITFRDGNIAIRNWSKESDPFLNNYSEYEKIDLWNNISRSVTTDLFIAATYVNFKVDMEHIYNVPNLISLADMPLRVILERGVAETHMHANAGISYENIWRRQMQFSNTRDKDRPELQNELWFCTFFRYYACCFLESNSSSFSEFIFCDLDSDKKFDWFIEMLQGEKTEFNNIKLNEFCVKNNIDSEIKDEDILFLSFYCNYLNRGVSAEILWFVKMIDYLHQSNDHLLSGLFMNYIRYKNDYFSTKIQQTKVHGLDYFTEFFDNATETQVSKEGKKFYYIFEEQFKYGNLKMLEMKISPRTEDRICNEERAICSIKRKALRQIKGIIQSYKEFLEKHHRIKKDVFVPQIGIIYHFIKREDSDNFIGANCAFANESGDLSCNDYNSMRRRYIVFMSALNQLLDEYPVLTDYVIGIDAAAKENATEPWVFAPVFKAARSSKKIIPYSFKPFGKSGNIQNLGFTYHVGEDFRHIVSGLRHIDEVLTYFDYRSGDRLGHALALGVDIDYLVSINSIVAVPIMEYLENLLWMWQYVNSTSDVGKIPENLEFKIMETARQIYNCNIDGIDVYTLWRVYQDKFKLLEDTCINRRSFNDQCSILSKLNCAGQKWDYQDLLMSHFCPCFYERYHKPIFVQMNSNVEFYKELQQSLIKKVERMGVYVETNPTSNTAIGDISSIFNHPILRLNNKGLGLSDQSDSCVLVTINSDDPVVFSTHVENEIAYIYYSLLNSDCRREEALEWINKIREYGINSSFIKTRKTYRNTIKDINEILNIHL